MPSCPAACKRRRKKAPRSFRNIRCRRLGAWRSLKSSLFKQIPRPIAPYRRPVAKRPTFFRRERVAAMVLATLAVTKVEDFFGSPAPRRAEQFLYPRQEKIRSSGSGLLLKASKVIKNACGPIRAPVSEGKICTPVSAVTIPRFRRRRGRNGLPFLLPLSRGAVSEVAAELSNCKFCRERCRPGGGKARCAFGYFYRIIKVARSAERN